MSAPFTVWSCAACGHLAYPPRILCPQCSGAKWERTLADRGVLEELTVRRPVFKRRQLPWGNWLDQEATRLGSVMTDVGLRIVARIPEGIEPGDSVRLVSQASTAIALPGQSVEARPVKASEKADSDRHVIAPMSDYPGRSR